MCWVVGFFPSFLDWDRVDTTAWISLWVCCDCSLVWHIFSFVDHTLNVAPTSFLFHYSFTLLDILFKLMISIHDLS